MPRASRTSNNARNYRDPRLRYPPYQLGLLPDPPDDWRLWGEDKRGFCGGRRVNRRRARELADFHSWGINPGIEARDSTERLMVALRKLMYYQSDHHRPPDYTEFLSMQRDAGPRLLRPDLDPQPLPISRFYPILPQDGESIGFSQDYIDNVTAQQRSYPSVPLNAVVAHAAASPMSVADPGGMNLGGTNTGSVDSGMVDTGSFNPSGTYDHSTGLMHTDMDMNFGSNIEDPSHEVLAEDISTLTGQESGGIGLDVPFLSGSDLESILPGHHQITQYARANALTGPSRRNTQPDMASHGFESIGLSFDRPESSMIQAGSRIEDLSMNLRPVSRERYITGNMTGSQRYPISQHGDDRGESSRLMSHQFQFSSPPNREAIHFRTMNSNTDSTVEKIQKAIIGIAYRDLERHPSSLPQSLYPRLIAMNEDDLLKVQQAISPATTFVRLSSIEGSSSFRMDPTGINYAYRGRGPMWRNNSCAVDSVIVAGKLLDAGCTNKDRESSEWERYLTDLERAYIQAINTNWDILAKEESMDRRDRFWQIVTRHIPGIRVGVPSAPTSIWAESTKSFEQFKFSYTEEITYCPCRRRDSCPASFTQSSLSPDYIQTDRNGVPMETLLRRTFRPCTRWNCRFCRQSTVERKRVFHKLPLRMVVELHEDARPRNHTAPITIRYQDGDGQDKQATYRWLGGIYRTKMGSYIDSQGAQADTYHFRVYWTDNERGEVDTSELRMYDGIENLGLIAGNIAPSHRDERVPEKWWKEQPIPLLFYERVLNPDMEMLSAAKDAVTNMIDVQRHNGLILQQLCHWNPSNTIKNPTSPERTGFQPPGHDILSTMPTNITPRRNPSIPAPGSRQLFEAYFERHLTNPRRNQPSSFIPGLSSNRQIQTIQHGVPIAPSSSVTRNSSSRHPDPASPSANRLGSSGQQNQFAFQTPSHDLLPTEQNPNIQQNKPGTSPSLPVLIEDDADSPGMDAQERGQHSMPEENRTDGSDPLYSQLPEHYTQALGPHLPQSQPSVPEQLNVQEIQEAMEAEQGSLGQQEENPLISSIIEIERPEMATDRDLNDFARHMDQTSAEFEIEYNTFNVLMMEDLTPNFWKPIPLKQQEEPKISTNMLWDWIGELQHIEFERMEEKWRFLDHVPEEHELWKNTTPTQASQRVLKRKRIENEHKCQNYDHQRSLRSECSRKRRRLGTACRVNVVPTIPEDIESDPSPTVSKTNPIKEHVLPVTEAQVIGPNTMRINDRQSPSQPQIHTDTAQLKVQRQACRAGQTRKNSNSLTSSGNSISKSSETHSLPFDCNLGKRKREIEPCSPSLSDVPLQKRHVSSAAHIRTGNTNSPTSQQQHPSEDTKTDDQTEIALEYQMEDIDEKELDALFAEINKSPQDRSSF